MADETIKESFLKAAEAWVCDGYALDIRFVAAIEAGENSIWDALITLNPLPASRDIGFIIDAATCMLGEVQRYPESRESLRSILSRAASGIIELPDRELVLRGDRPLYFQSEMSQRDRWFGELHLQVMAGHRPSPDSSALVEIDNLLRSASPPFDGLADVGSWLGLHPFGSSSNPPSINLRVGPPIDFIIEKCRLTADSMEITLHAHPEFQTSRASLAVRGVPGIGLIARKQIASEIQWGIAQDGRREGKAQVGIENVDQALVMLMIGNSTVRRHWFLDPAKARNNRLLAMQHFDKDLRMVKDAVMESPDSSKFENGIAALLFLLGLSPAVQLETDSPDLIATTPSGRLALIECTTRIADFSAKFGKLIDRRGALIKSLQASGHSPQVAAVLVCRLPRDQIATREAELLIHNTILVTHEDLKAAFERVRFPNDPERIFDDAQARLAVNRDRAES